MLEADLNASLALLTVYLHPSVLFDQYYLKASHGSLSLAS